MDERDSTSPESGPIKTREDTKGLRKTKSERSRSMLDLTDAAISQPVQGTAQDPYLVWWQYCPFAASFDIAICELINLRTACCQNSDR